MSQSLKGEAFTVAGDRFGCSESLTVVAKSRRDLRAAFKALSLGETIDLAQCSRVNVVASEKPLAKAK